MKSKILVLFVICFLSSATIYAEELTENVATEIESFKVDLKGDKPGIASIIYLNIPFFEGYYCLTSYLSLNNNSERITDGAGIKLIGIKRLYNIRNFLIFEISEGKDKKLIISELIDIRKVSQ